MEALQWRSQEAAECPETSPQLAREEKAPFVPESPFHFTVSTHYTSVNERFCDPEPGRHTMKKSRCQVNKLADAGPPKGPGGGEGNSLGHPGLQPRHASTLLPGKLVRA